MADSPLMIKSKAFALNIIRVCNEIKRSQKESILTNQLIRPGTSIGANIREAFYAHGKADFIAKLQIALKECSESEYWLDCWSRVDTIMIQQFLNNVLKWKNCWLLPWTQQKHEKNKRKQIPIRVSAFLPPRGFERAAPVQRLVQKCPVNTF